MPPGSETALKHTRVHLSCSHCLDAHPKARLPNGRPNTRVLQRLLRATDAVFATCAGCATSTLSGIRFALLVVDEASQVMTAVSLFLFCPTSSFASTNPLLPRLSTVQTQHLPVLTFHPLPLHVCTI